MATTERSPWMTTLCALCRLMSARFRSSVMTAACCVIAWRSAVWLGVMLSGSRVRPPLPRASRTLRAPSASGSSSSARSALVMDMA